MQPSCCLFSRWRCAAKSGHRWCHLTFRWNPDFCWPRFSFVIFIGFHHRRLHVITCYHLLYVYWCRTLLWNSVYLFWYHKNQSNKQSINHQTINRSIKRTIYSTNNSIESDRIRCVSFIKQHEKASPTTVNNSQSQHFSICRTHQYFN